MWGSPTFGVSCTTNSYHVEGTVSGLTSAGLVLHDNGGDELAVAANAGQLCICYAGYQRRQL